MDKELKLSNKIISVDFTLSLHWLVLESAWPLEGLDCMVYGDNNGST